MEKTKLYERDYYNMIIDMAELQGKTDIVNFAKKKIDQLNKKNASVKDNTQDIQLANMLIDEIIKLGGKASITELLTKSEVVKNYTYTSGKDIKNLSNQKITNIFTNMLKNNDARLTRLEEKGVPYYIATLK